MAIARVKPAGFGFGEKLTSAQATQLDVNVSSALDKIGDDVLESTMTVEGGLGGHIAAIDGAQVTISSNSLLAIQDTGRFRTRTAGGVQLGGGSSDWPVFTTAAGAVATRERYVSQGLQPLAWPLPTAVAPLLPWTTTGLGWLSSGTDRGNPMTCEITQPHDGATLTSVAINYLVSGTHAGGPPQYMPEFAVFRCAIGSATTESMQSAGPYVIPTPASGSAWYAGGFAQVAFVFCNQNNLIDREIFRYFIGITPEGGTNGVAGMYIMGATMTYAVSNMRFA